MTWTSPEARQAFGAVQGARPEFWAQARLGQLSRPTGLVVGWASPVWFAESHCETPDAASAKELRTLHMKSAQNRLRRGEQRSSAPNGGAPLMKVQMGSRAACAANHQEPSPKV